MPRDHHHVDIAAKETLSFVAARIVLGPLLLAQGRHVRRTTPRLPEPDGPRSGTEGAGVAPALRVLVVGDSSAAGVGVERQEAALAQPLARALAARRSGPVSWQLVAKSGICTAEAIDLLHASRIARADVLVTAIGMNDVTGQRAARFLRDFEELWRVAARVAGVRRGVVSGLPPLHALPAAPQPLRWYLGRYARHLDLALEQWVAQRPHLAFCPLQWAAEPGSIASDGFHPGPGGYARWSSEAADRVVELIGRR